MSINIPNALDPIAAVQKAFPDAVTGTKEFRGETTLIIAREHIRAVAQFVRDTPGLVYNYLSDISDVDYYPDTSHPGRYAVSYHVYSMLYNRRLRLKVYLPDEDPTVDSVFPVWPSANWLEREIFDLMGITFTGHPNLRRLQLPEDWDGHPHRRDYPLGYETVQFSFNVEEILKHKPRATE